MKKAEGGLQDLDGLTEAAPASPPNAVWRIGHFVFDPAARTLEAEGSSERISGKAAAVLLRLAEHAGKVVSREQLIAEVWAGNSYTGSSGLTHTVSQLRRSLRKASSAEPVRPDSEADEDTGPIETISKSGYRLLWPAVQVTGAEAEAPAPARKSKLPWLAGGVSVLLVMALALAWQARHGANTVAQRSLSAITTLEGIEESPAYSPDGHSLAYVWRRTGVPPRLRVVDLQRPEAPARELTDPQDRLYRPVWVDTHHLAYLQGQHGESCRVMLVDLRNDSRRDLAECHYLTGAATLAASPDGQWLAFSRRSSSAPGGLALMLHHMADGQERVLAQAGEGLGYGEMAWSHDGRHLAVLQLKDTVGDLVRLDVRSGEVLRLTRETAPIWALAWRQGDRDLVFSAGLAGDFALWRVDADGGTPSRFARIDNVGSLAAIPDGSGDVAASVLRYDDHIELYTLADGALRSSIRSSGRDLYADACQDAEHPIFVSFRARRIGVWYRDGANAEARELPLPAGTPEPPACSPDGRRYATVLSPSDGPNQLVIGDLNGGAAPTVIPVQAEVASPSWGVDGRTLIVYSTRENHPELWRFDPATQTFSLLTDDHAHFGREVMLGTQRWLYYARENQRGLWRRRLDDKGRPASPGELVLNDLAQQDWGNWAWHDGELWRISRGAAGDQLIRRDATGRDHALLTLPSASIGPFRSLSIDKTGLALVTRHGPTQGDLVRVPADGQ
ncbi:winged helix-turn-helix domain-containing protein [Ideonella azotifigens]|uniref:Winged helix-turn-helix domain-containing protein n=2 Tax=Ideonella azotifigens TaxID=513160 RepID=A0ABN1KES9_9BURK